MAIKGLKPILMGSCEFYKMQYSKARETQLSVTVATTLSIYNVGEVFGTEQDTKKVKRG